MFVLKGPLLLKVVWKTNILEYFCNLRLEYLHVYFKITMHLLSYISTQNVRCMTDNDKGMTKSSYKDFIYRSCDQDILFKITEHSYLQIVWEDRF